MSFKISTSSTEPALIPEICTVVPGWTLSALMKGVPQAFDGLRREEVAARAASVPAQDLPFPVATLRRQKYWSPVGRVDNVYGDRNLFCSCVPVSDYAGA